MSRFFGCGCYQRPQSELQPVVWAGRRNEWRRLSELTDEFNGNYLSSRKWFPYSPFSFGEKPGLFVSSNVSVYKGALRLSATTHTMPQDAPTGYNTWTTSAIVSRKATLYGYFESCFRASSSALESRFQLVGQEYKSAQEINAFSYSAAPDHKNFVYMDAWFSIKEAGDADSSVTHPLKKLIFDMPEKPVTVGIDWTPDYVKTYVDGQLIRYLENKHWHTPLHICFSLQTQDEKFGLPKRWFSDTDSKFEVYYIRTWNRYPDEKQSESPGLQQEE